MTTFLKSWCIPLVTQKDHQSKCECLGNEFYVILFLSSLDATQPKPHLPLSAIMTPSTESSSSAATAQSPSLSASQDPTVKPGEYPFKRGEFTQREDSSLKLFFLHLVLCKHILFSLLFTFCLLTFSAYLINSVPVLKTPSPSLKRSVSFPQPAGKIQITFIIFHHKKQKNHKYY